jgi:hypothetical protein
MTRDEVRNFKKAVQLGNKDAAAKLLERSMEIGCWRAKNIDRLRSLNIDQAFYCVANYANPEEIPL